MPATRASVGSVGGIGKRSVERGAQGRKRVSKLQRYWKNYLWQSLCATAAILLVLLILSMERAEFSAATTDQSWEIIGTDATLHVPMMPPRDGTHAMVLDRFVPGKGVVSETIWEGNGVDEQEKNVIDDFALAIRTGGRPQTDLERALLMQRITDAVYASAASGKSVALD